MSYDIKYIGMDVHKEAIVIAVLNESGKLVMESVIETKASSILQFLHGLRGELHVTWEEGTWAAWLYDLLQPQVQHIVVCNPRRNAFLKEGSKSDKVDAGKLADLLRTGMESCTTDVSFLPPDVWTARKAGTPIADANRRLHSLADPDAAQKELLSRTSNQTFPSLRTIEFTESRKNTLSCT